MPTARASLLSRADLAPARDLFRQAVTVSADHAKALSAAVDKYGERGAWISGIGQQHFPAAVKNKLRDLAREVTTLSNRAWAARPARVRDSTMRELAAAVANRYGHGFYGPQPNPRGRPVQRGALEANPRRTRKRSTSSARKYRYRCVVKVPGRRGHGYGGQTMEKFFVSSSDANALRYCSGLLLHKLPKGAAAVELRNLGAVRTQKKKRAARNPSPREVPKMTPRQERALRSALRKFREFTGHSADFVEQHFLPDDNGAAWALGRVSRIGYIADRGEGEAEYLHPFSERAGPLLASSSDGLTLYLLGGAFRVTDRGIEDDA